MYNIRVYALFIQDKKILVTDEFRSEIYMTKFPGGGLEPNEGLLDCLVRECEEEMGIQAKVKDHFYTTDFFIKSAFGKNQQLICIYYLMEEQLNFPFYFSNIKNDIPAVEGSQSFRWLAIDSLSEEDVTFAIDKVVVKKIKKKYAK